MAPQRGSPILLRMESGRLTAYLDRGRISLSRCPRPPSSINFPKRISRASFCQCWSFPPYLSCICHRCVVASRRLGRWSDDAKWRGFHPPSSILDTISNSWKDDGGKEALFIPLKRRDYLEFSWKRDLRYTLDVLNLGDLVKYCIRSEHYFSFMWGYFSIQYSCVYGLAYPPHSILSLIHVMW